MIRLFNLSKRSFVEFTSVRYPDIKRKNYSKIEPPDVDYFRSILSSNQVVTEDLEKYNVDWNKTVRGRSELVLKPKTTEEISLILKKCNERRLAVTPQGGNTGLVGGSNPVFDEIVLSTEAMNEIYEVDEYSSIVTLQSGVILEKLNEFLKPYGLMPPLDLGSKGSCQLGGNASTSAGGLRFLRYGNMHGNIIGLEAVLASGEILDAMTTMKKDNTGFDLKQLFIGSEGSLGIISKLSIQCPPRPSAVNVAFLACSHFENVLKTFVSARKNLGEILSSFEFFDDQGLEVVTKNLGLTCPIDAKSPFYVLIEVTGSNPAHDEEKLDRFLESCTAITDGTLAKSMTQIKSIWGLRERITEGLLHDGYVYKYDLSLPLSDANQFIKRIKKRFQGMPSVRVVSYGHVGDGNIHINVTSPEYDSNVMNLLEPYIYELVSDLKGSISAEHGIGLKKRDFMHFTRSESSIKWMKELKLLMDPHQILNPYKIFHE